MRFDGAFVERGRQVGNLEALAEPRIVEIFTLMIEPLSMGNVWDSCRT